ncbi:MAG: DUF350 domain-containing protein [Clostridium sp.]|nr:DUF350 domain-containing protein [Clostridium sp.]
MNPIVSSIIYLAVSCIMLFLSKFMFDKFSLFKPEKEVKDGNYTAVIAFCGYMVGMAFILVGAFVGPGGKSFKLDLIMYIAYAIVGIILMTLSGFVTRKIMLNRFDNAKELLQDKNIGTAAVYFGFYVAHGLIIAACVNGEVGGILSSVFYYVLSVCFMFVFLRVYDWLTPYSIHDELENDNYAVGIALAGNIIAIGIILMKATLGDVIGWKSSLITYFIDLSAILLMLPAVRFVLGNFIVKVIDINKEIKKNNVAAGLIEFTCITCFALLVFFMVDFTVTI